MRALNLDEYDEVSGGSAGTVMRYVANLLIGQVVGKGFDAVDKLITSPSTEFEITSGLNAVAAGNQTA